MLHKKDLSRVKEVWYCAEEDKPIERSDMVKGYEYGKGRYVVVEEDELKKIAPATATTMEIVQFVAMDEVDPLYFERSYYIGPDEKITKPYALFMQALKESGYYAIAKVTMHSREHVVLIRAADEGMVLHTMYYPDELHKANKQGLSAKSDVSRKELDLAKTLIEHLAGPFKPAEFHDTYRENVEQLIEEKKKGKKITLAPQPERAPVVDLTEALRRSLEAHKPAGQKSKARSHAPSSKTARRRKVA